MPRVTYFNQNDVLKHDKVKYNTNNFHERSPFRFESDNVVVLDTKFMEEISGTQVEDDIRKKYDIKVEDNVRYGVENPDNDMNYWYVYKTYFNWSDALNWYMALDQPVRVVKLSIREMETLIEIGRRYIINEHPDITEELEDVPNLVERIKTAISEVKASPHDGVFVKMGKKSTKHEFKPEEQYLATDVIRHLMKCKEITLTLVSDFQKGIEKQCILVKRWDDRINDSNEFRVIVKDKKVVGISQQALYHVVQEMQSVWAQAPNEVYDSINRLWIDVQSKLDERNQYTNCVFDAWIDNEFNAHLIEINSYGDWGPAGSSLYEWVSDPPKEDDLELRITTIMSIA